MSEFEQLSAFYEAIAEDNRIGAYHISLYITLVRLRSHAGWQNMITVYRSLVMQEARMGRKTFNKCMNDLCEYGYLRYEPSTNPKGGCKVYFNKL
ncbi:hypothetical protein SAMN05444410_10875 [Hydrobacter penzbergensis]|uniref:Uncharacterized protein n=1 Tax=Hydrobacter penzbergensis TaxID=1235997 RepID=A0A8X8LDX5_9BACT|nr:hypothetical protein SAMN05444410_10875 [Hydrobacter penzbergensis]